MSLPNAMLMVASAKAALTIILAFLFWQRKLHRRFPAMEAYLVMHAAVALMDLLHSQMPHAFANSSFDFFPFAISTMYVANAAFLYFICMEVFRSVLSPFQGLMKFGIVIFRWVALVSVIVGISTIPIDLSTVTTNLRASLITPSIVVGLTRSVSILELCLLIFICLSMSALRLSVRDVAFGISLGFGVISASDFVQSLLTTVVASNSTLYFSSEIVLLFVWSIWVVYFAVPEPVRKPILIPANSNIYRWNEIATALGHTGTRVAVQQPANGFFLTDVERVVEKVLARNLKSSESGS
jgi:hypothetical protein